MTGEDVNGLSVYSSLWEYRCPQKKFTASSFSSFCLSDRLSEVQIRCIGGKKNWDVKCCRRINRKTRSRPSHSEFRFSFICWLSEKHSRGRWGQEGVARAQRWTLAAFSLASLQDRTLIFTDKNRCLLQTPYSLTQTDLSPCEADRGRITDHSNPGNWCLGSNSGRALAGGEPQANDKPASSFFERDKNTYVTERGALNPCGAMFLKKALLNYSTDPSPD